MCNVNIFFIISQWAALPENSLTPTRTAVNLAPSEPTSPAHTSQSVLNVTMANPLWKRGPNSAQTARVSDTIVALIQSEEDIKDR